MNWNILINAALFQVTWFGAVLWGTAAAFVAIALMSAHAMRLGSIRADATLGALLAAVGLGLDTAWIYLGVLDYHGAVVAPAWIVLLWVAVGVSLNHSLSFLSRSPLVGTLLVAPAAAISYLGGERLGGVTVVEPLGLVVVAAAWSALFFVLLKRVVPFVNDIYSKAADGASWSRPS